tara:strand:+ start:269 stop:757 length:489 start_codon:yes stop_codon:yes gene_type:complete
MQASCAFVQEKSSAFFDDALSDAESSLIAEHLSSCEDCARIYAQLEKLEIEPPRYQIGGMDDLDDPDYWTEMDRVLDAEIERSIQNKERKFDYNHIILAALVLLCIGWGLYQQSRAQALSIVVDSQQKELERLHNIYMQVPVEVPNPYIPPQDTTQQVRYDL